jgi:hypothetical protein
MFKNHFSRSSSFKNKKMKHFNLTTLALLLSFAGFAQVLPITGPSHICDGSVGVMSDMTPGGTWTSSSPYLTISGSLGIATGIAAGTATITYTVGTAYATFPVTIDPLPGPIVGASSVCVGSSTTFAVPAPGGTWSIGSPLIAALSPTGILTGIAAGTATLTYTFPAGCMATMPITVNTSPAPITGTTHVCVGGTTTLYSATSGGMWSSANVTVASMGSSGVASGNTYGTSTINYTLFTGCTASTTVTVTPSSATFAVTGGGSSCAGGAGVHVNMPSSTVMAIYDLYLGGIPTGASVTGTGGPIDFGALTTPGTYTIIANAGGSCSSAMSGSAVISISALPVAYTVTGGGAICSGGPGVNIGLDGSSISTSYQLSVGGIAVGLPIMGTGVSIDFGLFTMAGTYTVIGIDALTGCMGTMLGAAIITTGTTPTIYSITGGGSYCAGGTGLHIALSNSNIGINYSLYNGTTLLSTIPGSSAPLDFGLSTLAGSYTIIATDPVTGCTSTTSATTIFINPLPTVYTVTGGGSYCAGGIGMDIALTGSVTGVNYTLYTGLVAVATLAGTGTALDFGNQTTAGTYTVMATNTATTCTSMMIGTPVISISPLVTPSVLISTLPGAPICMGTTVGYTANPTNGGISPTYTWTVNGVAAGTSATYSYMPANGDVIAITMTSSALCASPATATDNVTMTVTTPTVTATATPASCGNIVTLASAGAVTYSWSPSTGLSCGSCSTATMIPSATTTYTVTGTDGTGCTNTVNVTVNGNRISGYITYSGAPTDVFKIWLVQFDPTDSSITAQDSMLSCMDGGTPYYEFDSKPSGSYLIKANLQGTIPGTSGYIPTYGLSSSHWDLAAPVLHSSSADSMHINMIYGTVPSGPGFISGYVVFGAGKGTSGDAPVGGMTIYLTDIAGNILTYTYTAGDGTYSFGSLAYGTYVISPETMSFQTTPSAFITLAPGEESVSAVNFKKHTDSRTVTPYDISKVKQTSNTISTINIYPNPSTGSLNIQWASQATEDISIVIADVTGRTVYTTTLSLNTVSGNDKIDISGLENGVYIISIKGADYAYTNRLVVTKE